LRRANDLLGRFCSLLTLTPYAQWRRHHAKHHGGWNDLDRRNAHGRDLYSSCLTVTEYNALGTWRRLLHRTAKHPAISLLVLPPLIFLMLYRFPFAAPRGWRAERRSVHLTNVSLVALHGTLAAMLERFPSSSNRRGIPDAEGDVIQAGCWKGASMNGTTLIEGYAGADCSSSRRRGIAPGYGPSFLCQRKLRDQVDAALARDRLVRAGSDGRVEASQPS
jgi:hypothetical protein